MFAQSWNGVFYLPPPPQLVSIEMASDASGAWGCGAWCGQSWFQIGWNKQALDLQIAVKELIPIVVAAATWGKQWYRMRVICHCDNQAVKACLRSRTSKQDYIMHLLRCLVFFEACYQLPILHSTTIHQYCTQSSC